MRDVIFCGNIAIEEFFCYYNCGLELIYINRIIKQLCDGFSVKHIVQLTKFHRH